MRATTVHALDHMITAQLSTLRRWLEREALNAPAHGVAGTETKREQGSMKESSSNEGEVEGAAMPVVGGLRGR